MEEEIGYRQKSFDINMKMFLTRFGESGSIKELVEGAVEDFAKLVKLARGLSRGSEGSEELEKKLVLVAGRLEDNKTLLFWSWKTPGQQ